MGTQCGPDNQRFLRFNPLSGEERMVKWSIDDDDDKELMTHLMMYWLQRIDYDDYNEDNEDVDN